ncbi:MAG: OmpA family protein [Polyangiaceae bacterium]|nr:OmpA family protein [Polyangiaceae bacterium]
MGHRANVGLAAGIVALLGACLSYAPVPVYAVSDRGADRDGDGIADVDDGCAEAPEDGLPPKANDGCPGPDPDRDGVGWAEDQCPNAKEDGKPPNPADGCPGADADGDGVADGADRCADKREDNLAPEPSDGCPAPDPDGDGLAGPLDRCPDAAETYNDWRDADGCPDTVPGGSDEVRFDPESNQIYVPKARRIEFDSGSAQVRPDADATLGAIAQVLAEHGEIGRLEIEGHASSQGDERTNLVLTEQRAGAVARALAARGIAGERLVPIGYGEYCPARDDGDDKDTAENRRVLLKAVQVGGKWQEVARGCWNAQTKGIDPTKRKPGVPPAPPPLPPPDPGVIHGPGL